MREMSEPARYTAVTHDTLSDDVVVNARDHGPEVGYSRPVGTRGFRSPTRNSRMR